MGMPIDVDILFNIQARARALSASIHYYFPSGRGRLDTKARPFETAPGWRGAVARPNQIDATRSKVSRPDEFPKPSVPMIF